MTPRREEDRAESLEQQAARAGLDYLKSEGAIGCIVGGAGLAAETMARIREAGGEPAACIDLGKSANETLVRRAIELLLSDADVRVAIVSIMNDTEQCGAVARSLLQVVDERHPSIPFIVRLQGARARAACDLLASGPMTLMIEPDIERAVRLAAATIGLPSRKRSDPNT